MYRTQAAEYHCYFEVDVEVVDRDSVELVFFVIQMYSLSKHLSERESKHLSSLQLFALSNYLLMT